MGLGRSLRLGTLVIAISMLLVSCGGGSQGTSGNLSVSKVTVGFFPDPNPERVAQDKGWFDQTLGVPVTWKSFQTGASMMAAMSSGAINFECGAGSPPITTAGAQGLPVQVFWVLENAAESLVVKKNINSLQDLVGKKVGTIVGSTLYFAFVAALEHNNITVSSINVIDGTEPDLAAAFARGDLDGFYGGYPYLQQAIQAGGKTLITSNEVADKYGYFTFDACAVLQPWAQAHKDVLKKWVQVEDRAVKYYLAHPDDSYKSIGKQLGVSASEAANEAKLYTFPTACDQLSPNWMGSSGTQATARAAESMATTAQFELRLKRITSISSSFNPATVTDPEFAAAVCS